MIHNKFIRRRAKCFWCGEINLINHNTTVQVRQLGSPGTANICKYCGRRYFTGEYKGKLIFGRSMAHLRRRKMVFESKTIHNVKRIEKFIAWIAEMRDAIKFPVMKSYTDTAKCVICGGIIIYHVVKRDEQGTKVLTMGGCQTKGCCSWRE